MITTDALGTCAIMRLRMRAIRICRILPLIIESPSDCLYSSFNSRTDIFCRSYHWRYWNR